MCSDECQHIHIAHLLLALHCFQTFRNASREALSQRKLDSCLPTSLLESRIPRTETCALGGQDMVSSVVSSLRCVDVTWCASDIFHHLWIEVEVLLVELTDPQKYFEELMRFFYMFHDPTTKNRQGYDSGFQYASFVFCGDEEQIRIAQKVKNELQTFLNSNPKKSPYSNTTITTKIGPLMEFTNASESHQRYLEKNPSGYWWVLFCVYPWWDASVFAFLSHHSYVRFFQQPSDSTEGMAGCYERAGEGTILCNLNASCMNSRTSTNAHCSY